MKNKFMNYCKEQKSTKFVAGLNIATVATCAAGYVMTKKGLIEKRTFDGIKKAAAGVAIGDLVWLGHNKFWYDVWKNLDDEIENLFSDVVDTTYNVVDEDEEK